MTVLTQPPAAAPVAPPGVARASPLPFRLIFAYLLLTIALFVFGPLDWPISDYTQVLAYITGVMAFLGLGFTIGRQRAPAMGAIPSPNLFFYIGGAAAVLLLIPSARIYTGRWPWEVLSALVDQKAAYAALGEQLEITRGGRGPLVALRALFAPFTFAVLPLGIVYWRHLTMTQRALLMATVLSSMIFSVLRGTTRELADIVVSGGAAFLVSAARAQGGRLRLVQHWRRFALIGVIGALVVVALIGRTSARLGASALTTCIGGGTVCPAFQSPVYGRMNETLMLGLATVTGYLSQGYYGLFLALQKPFIWTKGLGHSAALISAVKSDRIYHDTYVYRLNENLWSDNYQWSTLMVWLASDLTFFGVLLFVVGLGYLFSLAWGDATLANNDRALIVFALAMTMLFYLPLNNQLATTFDAYATLLFWVVFWMIGRRTPIAR